MGTVLPTPRRVLSAHLSQLDTPRLGAARESWPPAFLCSLCRLFSPYDWDVKKELKAFRTTLSLPTRKVASPPQTWCPQLRPLLPLLMEERKPVCMRDLPPPAATPGYSAMKRNLTLTKKIKTFHVIRQKQNEINPFLVKQSRLIPCSQKENFPIVSDLN